MTVVEGGARFVLVGETPDKQHPGYMGCFPVGPDCAKRLAADGVEIVYP